jgi:hypothetical protein
MGTGTGVGRWKRGVKSLWDARGRLARARVRLREWVRFMLRCSFECFSLSTSPSLRVAWTLYGMWRVPSWIWWRQFGCHTSGACGLVEYDGDPRINVFEECKLLLMSQLD